jgi:hypothetical protein
LQCCFLRSCGLCGIAGTLPQEWGTLTQLQHLSLSGTAWRLPAGSEAGQWPASWANMSSLQFLDLSYPLQNPFSNATGEAHCTGKDMHLQCG